MEDDQSTIIEQDARHTLVGDVERGSLAAEEEVCRRHRGVMRRVINRYANNPADAEDWLSMSWVVALPKLRQGELRNPAALGSFLCGIARRVAAGQLRKRCHQVMQYTPEECEEELTAEDALETISRWQLIERTRQLVAELPMARDRAVLERCLFAGEDHQVVASELGVDASAFSKILHRAIKRLRALAEESGLGANVREYLRDLP